MHIKPYQVTKKFYKNVKAEIVYLGFPESALEQVLQKLDNKTIEKKDKKKDCKIKHYGRYVDDFVLIHQNKEYLKNLIPILSNFLLSILKLTLHPKKIYLQHFSKGVSCLGTIIKPHRIYITNRTKGNFYDAIEEWNKIIRANKKLTRAELEQFISSINSYLGIMKHYKTYKIRKKMLNSLSAWIFNQVYISGGYYKLVAKVKYR